MDRLKVEENISKQYCDILPYLLRYGFDRMSLADMESMQLKIIGDLDNFRRIDPAIGDLCTSQEYNNLEMKLQVLLEASDCSAQRAYLASQPLCSRGDQPTINDDNHNRACFVSIFKRRYAGWRESSCLRGSVLDHKRSLPNSSEGYIMCA